MQRHAVDEVVDWDDAGAGASCRRGGRAAEIAQLRRGGGSWPAGALCSSAPLPSADGALGCGLRPDRGRDTARLRAVSPAEWSVPLRGLTGLPEPVASQPRRLARRGTSTRSACGMPHGAPTAHSTARPGSIARRVARRAHCMRPAQVAVHYRAGDLVTSLPAHDGAALPPLLQQALSLAPPPHGAAPPAFAFDTRAGGRLLLLSYVLAALRAIRAALPRGAPLRLHLFAEGRPAWFEPLAEQLPGLQLHLTPPDGPPEQTLEHLHALTSADVFLLGGGASPSSPPARPRRRRQLAPANVWQGLPFRVPGERRRACTMHAASRAGGAARAGGAWRRGAARGGAGPGGACGACRRSSPLCVRTRPPRLLAGAEVVHYPSGVLAGAAEALQRLHAGRHRASHVQPATHQASTLPAGLPYRPRSEVRIGRQSFESTEHPAGAGGRTELPWPIWLLRCSAGSLEARRRRRLAWLPPPLLWPAPLPCA